ncbi:MAG: DUF4350 domain-containing protein [Terriglobales bacterium]
MPERFRGAPGWLLATTVAVAIGWVSYALLLGPNLTRSTPEFSSTRTDGGGSSALFNAYAAAGLRLVRSYDGRSLHEVVPSETTAFVLQPASWPDSLAADLLAFARAGGTVVLAGLPPPPPPMAKAMARAQGAQAPPPPPRLETLLRVRLVQADQKLARAEATSNFSTELSEARPEDMPLLHPEASLKLPAGWTPLYAQGKWVYAATRHEGHGRVIVASEATFLSNENLRQAPDPALLSWLTGNRGAVWVDETTHGLRDDPGIAWLLRRYHLRTAVLLLLAALGLAGWAVAATLELPPAKEPKAADEVRVALPASAGLARLLQRALPVAGIPAELRRRLGDALPPAPARRDEETMVQYFRDAVRQVGKDQV